MNRYGIEITVKNAPKLDPEFMPILQFNRAFLKTAKKPVSIAVERADGQMATCHTFIHGTPEMAEADHYYVNRLVKTILWMKGGFKVYVAGDEDTYNYLKQAYSAGGEQDFDFDYMANVFEHPFEVVLVDKVPEAKDSPKKMGGHLEGCRIGFDAGGSDRKVSAVVDGESVYSEEVVWFPKVNSDPDYHYEGIVAALKSAAEHMPRVDAVGVSSAGVYINNRTMNASLFLQVPKDQFDAKVKDIYIRAITDTFGDVPFEVVNDGAHFDELGGYRLKMLRNYIVDKHIAARSGNGRHISSGFDLVRNNGVGRAAQMRHAAHLDNACACAANVRAHRDTEVGKIDDVRLCSGVFDDSKAAGLDCGEHNVDRRADGDFVKVNLTADEPVCLAVDHAVGEFDLSAERFKAFYVQIDRAHAEIAPPGRGDLCL